MVRLFKAHSIVEEFLGQDRMTFNWFAVGRPAPILPYDRLIQDFDESDDESWYDKMFVDELLTMEEVVELRTYLWNHHGIQIQIEEVALPVKSGHLSYGLLLISGEKGFYSLADEDDYQLSISILGHFKPKDAESLRLLSEEDIQIGSNFLLNAFKRLGLPEFEECQIAQILNDIYSEQGLYVQKDTKGMEESKGKSSNN